jgi:uncharacterized membrane protein YedE/YeeE
MENFTPVSGFIGGLLIGGSATLLILLTGRVAGISGILGSALDVEADGLAWRLAFLVGLVLGPLGYGAARGAFPELTMQASLPVLIVAGLLVGFGTRMGGGCTSGHGVCGMARLSPRSLAATATFFVVAAVTVFIVRHVIGG